MSVNLSRSTGGASTTKVAEFTASDHRSSCSVSGIATAALATIEPFERVDCLIASRPDPSVVSSVGATSLARVNLADL